VVEEVAELAVAIELDLGATNAERKAISVEIVLREVVALAVEAEVAPVLAISVERKDTFPENALKLAKIPEAVAAVVEVIAVDKVDPEPATSAAKRATFLETVLKHLAPETEVVVVAVVEVPVPVTSAEKRAT